MTTDDLYNKDISDMDSDEFEQAVGEIWENRGYDANVTKGSGDRGADVIAHKPNEQVIIEAKKWSEQNKVGRPVVHKLAGAQQDHGADRAVIVTTSDFTDEAEDSADEIGIEYWNGEKTRRKWNNIRPSQTTPSLTLEPEQVIVLLSIIFLGYAAFTGGFNFSVGNIAPANATATQPTDTATQSIDFHPDFARNAFVQVMNRKRSPKDLPKLQAKDGCSAGDNLTATVPLGEPIERSWREGSITLWTGSDVGRYLANRWIHTDAGQEKLMDPTVTNITLRITRSGDTVDAQLSNCE